MKKLILTLTISLICILTVNADSHINVLANPQIESAEDILAEKTEDLQVDEIIAEDDMEAMCGYHYMPADNYVPVVDEGVSVYSSDKISLEPKYIPDYSDMPKIRSQSPYGTCWAHSAMASAEMNMLKKDPEISAAEINYSELALAYYAYHTVEDPLGGTEGDNNTYVAGALKAGETIFDVGGNWNLTPNVLTAWVGATNESDVPYSSATNVINNGLDSKYAYKDVAHLRNYYKVSLKENRDLAKNFIKTYGALSGSYFHNMSYYNSSNNCYYNNKNTTTNHAIAIVGWDDTFDASNFNTTAPGKGAWLIRNSWNTYDAYKESVYSYFWMSYYDTSLADAAYAFDYDLEGVYDNNYQYDGGFSSATLSATKGANVFTVKASDQEVLKAVGFAVSDSDVSYSIDIYENLTKPSNPTSGTLVSSAHTEGMTSAAGFYTVDLANPVPLNRGDTFSVVVSVDKNSLQRENAISWSWCGSTVSADANQSFKYYNNVWTDIGNSNGANIRIKAYTVNGNGETVLPSSIAISGGDIGIGVGEKVKLAANILPLNTTDRKVIWESSDSSVVTVDASGNITGVAKGSATITAKSKAAPSVKDSIVVTVDDRVVSIELSYSGYIFSGDSYQLTYKVNPASAKYDHIEWSSSDENIATVDQNGTITTKKAGDVVITAKIGEVTGTYNAVIYPNGVDFFAEMDESGKVTLKWKNDDEVYCYRIKRSVNNGSQTTLVDKLMPNGDEQIYVDSTITNPNLNYTYTYTVYKGVLVDGGVRMGGYSKTVYGGEYYTITYAPSEYIVSTENCIKGYRKGNTNLIGTPEMKRGYVFNNWGYTNSSGGTSYTKNVTYLPGGNLTLTGNVTKQYYYVRFNGNESTSGTTSVQKFDYLTSAALRKNTFYRTGYTFNGWNTKADGSGTAYTDAQVVSELLDEHAGYLDLYAQWKCAHPNFDADTNSIVVPVSEATCQSNKIIALKCPDCKEIVKENVEIKNTKLEHSYSEPVVASKATFTTAGSTKKHCSVGNHDDYVPIGKPTAALSFAKTYTYSGSPFTPAIVVKDADGVEIASSEYEVAYSNNINAGTAKATVTFKSSNAKYSGSKAVNFTINKATAPATVPADKEEKIAVNKKVSDVELMTGWEWSATDASKALPRVINNYINATANYVAADKGNYINLSKVVKITMTSCDHVGGEAVRENETDSDCQNNGSYDSVVYCTICGSEMSREALPIPLKEHTYRDYVSDHNATCASDGTKTAYCIYGCGNTDTIADVGSQTNTHPAIDPDIELVSAATCQSNKIVRHSCHICGTVLNESVEVPDTKLECEYEESGRIKASFDRAGTISYRCKIGNHAGTPVAIPQVGALEVSGEYSYTGEAILPALSLIDSRSEVIPSDYYTVEGINNVNAGTAQVRIAFKASCPKYTGSQNFDFTIKKANRPAIVPGNLNTKIEIDKKVDDVSLPAGWVWSNEDKDRLLPSSAGDSIDVTAVYTGVDKDNYVNQTIDITITMTDCDHEAKSPVEENRIEATCLKGGSYDLVVYCGKCGNEIERNSQVIPKLSHSFTNYVANGNATCKEDGTKTAICDRGCGISDTVTDVDSKSLVSHNDDIESIENEVPATCMAAGSHELVKKCSVCGAEQSRTPVADPIRDHEYVTYVSNADATCTEDGTKTAYCRFGCGNVDTIADSSSAKGHSFVQGKVLRKATYRESGLAEFSCRNCSAKKTDVIPKLEYDKIVEKQSGDFYVDLIKGGKTDVIPELVKAKTDKTWKATYSIKGVATVNNKGFVKASKAGKTVATVNTAAGVYTVYIEVKEPKMSKGTLEINAGDTIEDIGFSGTGIERQYVSSKPDIASVDSITGEVTAHKFGKAKITVIVCGKKYTKNVSVLDPIMPVKKPFVKVGSKMSLKVKQGAKLTTDWKSSNTDIAIVDSKGKVTGITPGTVTISALNNGIVVTTEITVVE